jgi:hypothetical protein
VLRLTVTLLLIWFNLELLLFRKICGVRLSKLESLQEHDGLYDVIVRIDYCLVQT